MGLYWHGPWGGTLPVALVEFEGGARGQRALPRRFVAVERLFFSRLWPRFDQIRFLFLAPVCYDQTRGSCGSVKVRNNDFLAMICVMPQFFKPLFRPSSSVTVLICAIVKLRLHIDSASLALTAQK